jgi:hypothetical protein
MGQLDSTCRAPPRQAGGEQHEVAVVAHQRPAEGNLELGHEEHDQQERGGGFRDVAVQVDFDSINFETRLVFTSRVESRRAFSLWFTAASNVYSPTMSSSDREGKQVARSKQSSKPPSPPEIGHAVALQVAFERQTLTPVFDLIGYRLWV